MPDVNPTRSNLLELREKIELAETGHTLLKKKRDGLIYEFFEVMKKAKSLREDLADAYETAQEKLNVARTLESDFRIRSLALSIEDTPEFDLEAKNIVGVRVPEIQRDETLHKRLFERGHGYYNSAAIDEAAGAYEEVVERVIEVAEIETTMRRMLDEIEKTNRRVNALETRTIPDMEDTAEDIERRLEEQEREEFTRLKLIKDRLEEQ